MLISPRYPVVITFHHVWGYSQYIPTISLIFVGYIFHLLFTPDVCYFNPPVGVVRLTSWIGSCEIDRRVIGTSTRWARSCNWLERPRFPTFLFSSRQGSNQLGQLYSYTINWLDTDYKKINPKGVYPINIINPKLRWWIIGFTRLPNHKWYNCYI
jgi:hypothetical protein